MSTKDKSTSSSPDANGVTPLGLAVAAIVICVLAVFAVPRLRAVSEERGRPEAPRVLSAYGASRPASAVSDSCGCCGVGAGASRAGQ